MFKAEMNKIISKGTDSAALLKKGEKFTKQYYYIEVFPSTYRVVRDFATATLSSNAFVIPIALTG